MINKFGMWEFGFKLNVKVSEIDEIATMMKAIMEKNQLMMKFTAMVLCSCTIAAVIIFTFKATMSIAKPLKTLIRFADLINSNATEKDFMETARSEVLSLPEVLLLNYLEG